MSPKELLELVHKLLSEDKHDRAIDEVIDWILSMRYEKVEEVDSVLLLADVNLLPSSIRYGILAFTRFGKFPSRPSFFDKCHKKLAEEKGIDHANNLLNKLK